MSAPVRRCDLQSNASCSQRGLTSTFAAAHRFFNTNNLWINLEQLQTALTASGGALDLPLIKNKKTVNPRDSSSTPVFQLETAMGSAIECFSNAGGERKAHSEVLVCWEDVQHRSAVLPGFVHRW